jgi:hypothetical protein
MSDNPSSNETQPPQPSADSLDHAAPTDDPIKKLVGEMSKIAGTLGPELRELKERIGRLAVFLEKPERVQQPGFRTGVAYALQDLQKVSHATFQMDSALAQEMKDRAITSPGLINPRVEALMQATPSVMDAELVRGIREIAASATRRGSNQDTPQLREEIDVLENRLRLAQAPRADGTSHRLEATAQRTTTGVTPDPSPRTSTSPEERQDTRSAQHAGTIPPQQSRGAVGDIMRSLRMPIPSGLEYRAAPPATAVGARISMFEQRLAQGRTDRLIQNAERSGVRAIEATEQFITGPGRGILGKMEAAASTEPGGMQTVMKEMQPGGRYANLRTEFDSAYQQDKIFAGAYDKMVESAAQFGKERLAVNDNFVARNLDARQLDGRFQRAEEALGEAAEKIPGRTPGKSALDEMAEKVAELLHKAADKVKSFFGRDVNSDATQQGRPSPRMSM